MSSHEENSPRSATVPRLLERSEREQAAWLGEVERQMILPLKWLFLLFVCLYWLWVRGWQPPGPTAFGLFIFFLGLAAAEQYFIARDRVTPRQIRPFILGAFVADVLFASLLVVLDVLEMRPSPGPFDISEFFLLYLVLILRGFALFRTRTQSLAGFIFVSLCFVAAAIVQLQQAPLINYMPSVQKLVLVWAVMLFTQAFISLVNEQKEEQVRAAERIVRSSSLASLGELTAGVAHEINNPIGIIRSYAEYLEKSVQDDSPLKEDFQTIRTEAERCEQIVRRMLDFSNPQLGGIISVDLRELVEDTAAIVFHESQVKNIHADVVCNGRIPAVMGDPIQLRQALLNILVNARQVLEEHHQSQPAPPQQGRVTVTLSRSIGPRPPVRIEVHDNGPGISPGDIERVFEPFFTRRHKGTGFGLAITRRIVEAHHGTIHIAPHPEGGTVVTIELPIEGEEEA